MKAYLILTIKDGLPDELLHLTADRKSAELHFLDACRTRISNFDEYGHREIEGVLADGYEWSRLGAVCFLDLSNTPGFLRGDS